ncbi:MAG: hypothetical protein PHC86_01260 [Eubacteriales bacterium]|nr:hypothetical protein [Eubacteriales bacterium]
MDLIDRYIYAVTRRLPTEQRSDIEKELRGLIEDMLAASADLATKSASGPASDQTNATIRVLKDLGHPALLAARYRGSSQHLIGPEIYFLYTMVMKIVLLATGGGLLIAMIVSLITGAGGNPFTIILETLGSLISGLAAAFGWVTLVFAAIERFSPEKIKLDRDDIFDPLDLPEIPAKKDRIHPSDPIASMIFMLIAMVVASFVPRFVGIFWLDDPASNFIPLFNSAVFMMYLPFILATMAITLTREIGKLVSGRWTLGLALLSLGVEIPSLILTIVMMSNKDLFNDAIFTQIFAWLHQSDPFYFDLPMKILVGRIVIGLGVFGFVVEAVKTFVFWIKRAD